MLNSISTMDPAKVIEDLLYKDHGSLPSLLNTLHSVLRHDILTTDSLTEDLITPEFLEEVKNCTNEKTQLYFGKSLKDLKVVIIDQEFMREHEVMFQYKNPKKLIVISTSFPFSSMHDQEYRSVEDLVTSCRNYLDGLSGYFYELECIDRCCSVMEPVNPSFKEDYRRILLDDRTWLHVEVTLEGLATNIHLIGQPEYWQDQLQSGLLKWDHDVDIVSNIMNIFDILEFPTAVNKSASTPATEYKQPHVVTCSICLCDKLPDISGIPLPLCQNHTCGMYFHRNCLYQWLVACSGGRPPAFGVANGSCPSCLQPVACNEKDS